VLVAPPAGEELTGQDTDMPVDLFGHDTPEIIAPEADDALVLTGWDAFKFAWQRKAEGKDELSAAEHRELIREMDRGAAMVLKAPPPRTLEGIRAKLCLCLCSGPDAETFLQHFALGHRLPRILPFSDPATCMAFDAVVAIERLALKAGTEAGGST
jgi:hypothetical protein